MRIVTLALLAGALAAQENPWLAVDGRNVAEVNPDDARAAGIVARSLVYQATRKGSPSSELRALMSATVAAFAKEDWNRAWRLSARLNTILEEETAGEETEVAASLDFQADRRVLAPGESMAVRLQPLFVVDKPLQKTYRVHVAWKTVSGDLSKEVAKVDLHALEPREWKVEAPREAGHYILTFELSDAGSPGKRLTWAERDFFVYPDLRSRVGKLQPKLAEWKDKVWENPRQQAAFETAEYLVDLLDRLTREYVADCNRAAHPLVVRITKGRLAGYTSDVFRYPEDMNLAEELTAALAVDQDPLRTHTGDLHLAHRSRLDRSLQPFRVYVPSAFDPSKRYPLIVALHGAAGDENAYMDRYRNLRGERLFQKLGEERGYILVTPNARGPYGEYMGNAEKDVLEVLNRVKAIYPIREDEVFLTGHSMGGGGTWHIGFGHAKLFRALAPVASGFGGRLGTSPSVPLTGAPEMPVLFSYGLKDTLATPENSRQLAVYAGRLLKNFEAREYPDDHFVVGVTSMAAIFDFFDRFRNRN